MRDPILFPCDDNWCYGERNHVLVYVDDNHLSRTGSLLFADTFAF